MKKVLFILLLGFLFSCQREEIETFDNDVSFLAFSKNFYTDSLEMSFMFYFSDEVSYPIEVVRSGKIYDEDIEYTLSVDTELTNLPTKNYEIPSSFIFRKNLIVDTAYILLKNSVEMQDTTLRLVLNIDSNEYVTPGVVGNRKVRCFVTDKVVRPDWWDSTIEYFYLGTYSEAKYTLFIQVTQVTSLAGMNSALIRKYALQFKAYLEENPTPDETEADGIMKVTVIV